jgi:threonine/homoserine/homoserine lactone efflux protein
MADVAGEILAFAVGIAISPIPIIAVILMLFSARARINGPAFLLGWVAGITAVMVIVLVVANAGDVSTDSDASNASGWLKLVLGLVLVVLGFRQLRNRPAPGEQAAMPAWMTAIDSFTPVKALAAGFVLSALNPKNLILEIGSATTLAQAGLSGKKDVAVIVFFVVVSSLTVGGAVLFYLVGGQRAKTLLDGWKVWLAQNNAVVMCVLLVVIGVALAGKGFDAFD